MDQLLPEMRRTAKMVNFGIIYGISAFGLSQRLGIPRSESATIIENYFKQFPGVKRYIDQIVIDAKRHGYVETLSGRRRYLRDINSANATIRAAPPHPPPPAVSPPPPRPQPPCHPLAPQPAPRAALDALPHAPPLRAPRRRPGAQHLRRRPPAPAPPSAAPTLPALRRPDPPGPPAPWGCRALDAAAIGRQLPRRCSVPRARGPPRPPPPPPPPPPPAAPPRPPRPSPGPPPPAAPRLPPPPPPPDDGAGYV